MRKTVLAAAALLASFMVGCTSEQSGIQPTKNLIVLLTDGTSTSALAVTRWYKEYADSANTGLNLDPYICGLVRSSHADSPIVASAGSMSSYMTGQFERATNICVYPTYHEGEMIEEIDTTMSYQPLATIAEAGHFLEGKSTGLVVTVEYPHATPAACASHAYNRYNYHDLGQIMTANRIDVMFGGGKKYMTDKCKANLALDGITYTESVDTFKSFDGDKLWALFAPKALAYDIDREADKEPSLAEMTDKAIRMLSRNKNGFFLMVEGSKVDYAAHANDAFGIITELLAFDDAVKVALDFAKKDGNTTVVIVTDHGNSAVTLGDRYYEGYTDHGLEAMYGGMRDYKASYSKIAALINEAPVEDIRGIFKQWTNIDLTDEEYAKILAFKGVKTNDYMKAALEPNLEYQVAVIMSSRTHLGFASGNHTGEDVFLSIYNPKGQRPEGWITNIQFNDYLCSVMGLQGKLPEVTKSLFKPHTELLEGYEYTIGQDADGDPQLTVKGSKGDIQIPCDCSYVIVNGEKVRTDSPTVYIQENNKFYLSESVKDLL